MMRLDDLPGKRRLTLGRILSLPGSKELFSGKKYFSAKRNNVYACQQSSSADRKLHSAKDENDDWKNKASVGRQKKADTDLNAKNMPVVNAFYLRNGNDAAGRITLHENRRIFIIK